MPEFTSEMAREAGAKAGEKRGKRKPVQPQTLLSKSLRLLNDAMNGKPIKASQMQAASRVLGVLYDAGVKPTTRDDNLSAAIGALLSPPAEPTPVQPSELASEAPKKEGGA
jgi:hypothetical protein